VREELAQYSEALGQKPTVVCLNKADLLSQETLKSVKRAFQRRGIPLLVISAQAGTNIEKLRELIYDKLSAINVTNAEGSVPPVAANRQRARNCGIVGSQRRIIAGVQSKCVPI
jgi:GTPase involved in cell partitioning and DNA repair